VFPLIPVLYEKNTPFFSGRFFVVILTNPPEKSEGSSAAGDLKITIF